MARRSLAAERVCSKANGKKGRSHAYHNEIGPPNDECANQGFYCTETEITEAVPADKFAYRRGEENHADCNAQNN